MRLENKVVLVTGGSGLLGKNLVPVLEQEGAKVIAPTSTVMDITNTSLVFQAISWHNPDIVVHCAAYTNVPDCESISGKRKANFVNIHGSKNVIEASHYFGAKVVYISTDYVYNGTGNHFVGDKTYPTTYYGVTKLVGESFCDEKDLVLRLSFKDRGTWGKDKYTNVIHPVKTNADFVDIVSKKICDAISNNWFGIKNLGTKEKYLKDLALEDYKKVVEISPQNVKSPYIYPQDCTMKLDT